MTRLDTSSKEAELSEYGIIRTSEGHYSHPKLCCVDCKTHGKIHCLFKTCDLDRERRFIRLPKCLGCQSNVLCTAVQYERQHEIGAKDRGTSIDLLEDIPREGLYRRLDDRPSPKQRSAIRAKYRFYKPKRKGGPLERRMGGGDEEEIERPIDDYMLSPKAAEADGSPYNYDGTDAFGLSSGTCMLPTDGACDEVSGLHRIMTLEEIFNPPRPTKRKASSIDNDSGHSVKPVTSDAGQDSGTSAAAVRPRAVLKPIGESEGERRMRTQHAKTSAVSGATTRKVTGHWSGFSPYVRPAPAVYRRREAMPRPAAESALKSALKSPSDSISGMVVKLEKENEALKAEVAANKLTKDNRVTSLKSSLAKEKEERTKAQIKLVIAEEARKRWEREAQAQHREIVSLNDRLTSQERLVERYKEIEALVKNWQ